MAEAKTIDSSLFPELGLPAETSTFSTGVLPSQHLRQAVGQWIKADNEIGEEQIQPASIDLRLGTVAYRVQASFLPSQRSTVAEKISRLSMATISLESPTLLERDCVYIIPAMERFELPSDTSGYANPRSTTGRLDIFTRLIADYSSAFDRVPKGYTGKVFLEVVPRTFPIIVSSGMRLCQVRLVRGSPPAADSIISALDEEESLVFVDSESPGKAQIKKGLWFSVCLETSGENQVVAYKAKRNAPAVDLSKVNYYEPDEFWEPILSPRSKELVLDPGDFYILASKERVRVPIDVAAEMVPFDASIGEFRVHYAGFFDPGFGYGASDIKGTRAVLEVRAHDVPALIEDGQYLGRLRYMRLLCRPDKIYSQQIGSSYQSQELTLSKQFKRA